MLSIHKFPVHVRDLFELRLPKGAEFLSVQQQYDATQSWWVVDLEQPKRSRFFRVRGTGHEFVRKAGETEKFLGTFQLNGGTFVGHLFEVLEA